MLNFGLNLGASTSLGENMKKLLAGFVAVFAVIAVVGQGCGSKGPEYTETDGGFIYTNAGPVDGTWLQTGTTCNGTAATMDEAALITFANTTGSLTFGDSTCRMTKTFAVTYPNGTSLTWTNNGTYACAPAACDPDCGDPNTDPNETFNYTVTSTTLKVSNTQVGGGGECNNGQTIEYTLAKQ
jgi:hypothetical protein